MPFFNDALDDALLPEVVQTFANGQNSYIRASLLQEGQASLLRNVLPLGNGQIRKRAGTRSLGSGFVSGEGNKIQAMFYYDTPVATALVAFANKKAFYYDGLNWQLYFDAALGDKNEVIDVVQLMDMIYFTDSTKEHLQLFDGSSVSEVTDAPRATILKVLTNRLAASGIDDVPDGIYFSDLLDGETWNINNFIRVGGGEGSPIVAIQPWQEQNLLIFKRQGIYLANCDPTVSTAANFSVLRIHNTIGCVAKNSVAQLGQDVWFLSRNGVMSVQKQIATSQNVVAVPMSQAIQDMVERIRWEHVEKSCAITYNNMYLLAVPINDDVPDTILVYHFLTGGWTHFTGWNPTCFLEQPFHGTTRLLMGYQDGELREWLDYLRQDQLNARTDFKDNIVGVLIPFQLPLFLPPAAPTVCEVITRALTYGDIFSTKSPFYGSLECLQRDGTVSISIIRDGHNPELIGSYEFFPTGATLPVALDFQLPVDPDFIRKSLPLFDHDDFTELKFRLISDSGALTLRRITCQAFLNTVNLLGD
jgi:hypothetical protein